MRHDDGVSPGVASHELAAENSVPVTRIEVLDFVGDAFDAGPRSGSDLLAHARAEGGRPALLDLLAGLAGSTFERPDQLWAVLPPVPVDLHGGAEPEPR